jgi:hypothetical protein
MDIRTGWLKVANLQGFQRVKRLYIIGEYKSYHKLLVSIYTDYSEIVKQQIVIDTSLGRTPYGTGVYGVESPYGGAESELYQFEIHLKQQKCTSMSIRIQDINDNSEPIGTGEAFNLVGVSVKIGMKVGGPKLAKIRKN